MEETVARHTGATPVGPPEARPERRQRVRVPWMLVESAFYADIALAVYVKVKALGQRPEGCTAGTATLASYIGMSTSSVERGLAQLRNLRPDGQSELPENTRRSLPGGTGTTARRRVRSMAPTERFVWLPVAACEDLKPRQLRAYAVMVFTQAQRIPLTLSELAGYLRHHSGKRAGRPISATAAAAIADDLEASGWVSVERRTGGQGRNQYVAHDIPRSSSSYTDAAPATATRAPSVQALPAHSEGRPSPQVGDGSGSPVDAGSLATKEDRKIARPENEPRLSSPAVGEPRVVDGASVGDDRGWLRNSDPARPLALRADANRPSSPSLRTPEPAHGVSPRPRSRPELTLSPQIYSVLEPVHWLLQRIDNSYVLRRIGREVGRQLREGMEPERLHHRLTVRFAGTIPADIRDPGRWLLGVALPRWGCGHLDCEAGVMWSTGSPCAVCAEIVADRRAARRRRPEQLQQLGPHPSDDASHVHPVAAAGRAVTTPTEPAPQGPARANCAECGCRIFLTGQALTDGLCRTCREEQQECGGAGEIALKRPSAATCAGWEGMPCDRLALPTRNVCARHRALQVAGERQAS
ncbi:hypothetical protein ACFYZ9_34280 [Streptomyces sp. NPDC001691]|uniref:hypothetical protein n=1 Tax=Streptomyces sp. NPDC001691 TaxID=3364600 RepID=UPI0036AAE8CA